MSFPTTCGLLMALLCCIVDIRADDGEYITLTKRSPPTLKDIARKRGLGALAGMELPDLSKLMTQDIKGGTKYVYEGCKIEVTNAMSKFKLDLKDKKCQNIVSIPRIFEKLTKKKLEGTKLFAPLDKFNVDLINFDRTTKDVSFTATAKEPFKLLPGTEVKVKKAKVSMDFNYGAFDDFEKLGLDITGEIMIGSVKVSVSLVKTKKSVAGKFNLQATSFTIADFYQAFTKNKELDSKTKASTSSFTNIKIVNPRVTGVRDKKGNSELVVTGAATEIPGMGQGSFFVIIQVQDGKPAQVGVIVKLNEIKPAAIIFKLTGLDLKNVPIINDLQLDIVIEYANDNIGMPKDKDIKKILSGFSKRSSISAGTKLKFMVPFKDLIKKNGVDVPTGTNLDQYINIIIKDGEIDFEFDDDAPMDLLNVLIAFIPKFSTAAFEKVFKSSPKIKFKKFKVNVKTSAVDIALETTEPIPLGTNFLKLKSAKFTLQHKENGPWDFSFSSDLRIGDGSLVLSVKKVKDKYTLTGTIDKFSTTDIAKTFNVDENSAMFIKKIKALQFGLRGVTISAEFDGDKLNLKIVGEAILSLWSAKFEGYIVDTKRGVRAMAFGLVVTNVGINKVAAELFAKDDKSVSFLNAKWMSQVTASITAANDAAKDEVKFKSPELSGKGKRKLEPGVQFAAKIVIPKGCKEETICEFVKKKIGAGQELVLAGVVRSDGFTLSAGFDGNIQVNERFSINEAKLSIIVVIPKGTAAVEISGKCKLKMKDHDVTFNAALSVSAAGTVKFTLSVDGTWENPFGLQNFQIAKMEMTVGFSFITLLPTFIIAGELRLGTGREAIVAQLAGGFESGPTPSWHFYAKFNKISIQAILDAFNTDLDLPQAVGNSGFPKGLTAGMSFPKGYEIKSLNVKLKPGFFFHGELNILGYTILCQLEVDLPKRFYLKASFAKLELAGGAILLSNVDKKSGPTLVIELGVKTLKIQIDAYVEILKIGIGAKIDISNKGIKFAITGKFLDLFEASLTITAPYGSLKDMPSSNWKVESCLSAYVTDKLKDGATSVVSEGVNATERAGKEGVLRTEHAGSWYYKAMEKVNYWKQKLLKKEAEFQAKAQRLEEKKKKMDPSCVAKCEKKRVWVGGFGEKTCIVAGKKVQCPYWIEEKAMRDDPYCLSKCESSKFKLLKKAKGGKKLATMLIMEEKMEFYATMLTKVEAFFRASQALIEYAEQASQKIKQIAAAGSEALAKVKQFTAKYLFYINKVCISSSMQKASKGLCFTIDADLYIGGKSGKHIVLKNEEGCFNLDFAKQIGMKMAQKAFPGIEKIMATFSQAKELFKKSDQESKEVYQKSKDVEEQEKNSKRTIANLRLAHYRTDEIINSFPEVVVRNDESMRAFRDTFTTDDLETVANIGDGSEEVVMENRLNFDTRTLQNTTQENACKRTSEMLNVYNDVLESINFFMGKTQNVKSRYNLFIKEYQDKFNVLGQQLLNDTYAMNMNPDDTEDTLFYVNKAKTGIKQWQKRFDTQYDQEDKKALSKWRGFLNEFIVDKGLDVATFQRVLGEASKAAAKRTKIPGNNLDIEQSINKAEEVVQGLLANDDATLSSKGEAIALLGKHVKTMMAVKSDMKC